MVWRFEIGEARHGASTANRPAARLLSEIEFPRPLVDRFSLSFQRSFLECLAECRVGMDHRAHVLKS